MNLCYKIENRSLKSQKDAEMNNKTTGAENVRWDLGFLYSGTDDPQIDADIENLEKMASKFKSDFKGKLAEKLGPAISGYSEIEMLKNKFLLYFSLKQSLNVSDPEVKAKISEVERRLNHIQGEFLTFFVIEIATLEKSVLETLYSKDEVVKTHRPWIEHLRIFKPHMLSDAVESALAKRMSFGPDSWGIFFDEVEAGLEFDFLGSKKTLTEMLFIMSESGDTHERFEVMKLVNEGLRKNIAKYSAQALYITTGSNGVENRERGYVHPMEYRNKCNRISDKVVEVLHKAVEDTGSPLIRRYYKLKAAHLGLEILKWSDRNAPMPFDDTSVVPFDKGLKVVLSAYGSFSPRLADLILGFINSKCIDAPAIKGKRGGAFNSSVVLPSNLPVSFTFLNYLGSNRDVMTLAHELGHGVHGLLAGKEQGPLMSNAPIAYCEIASVFGEMTTFNFLKKTLLDSGELKPALALTMRKIDDIINTVVRQIGFSNFERRIHGLDPAYSKWHEPKKMSSEELSQIWLETVKMLYGGEGEVFTYSNAEYLWSYVSHFYAPFYVYAYAFGELLTQSIYAQQEKFGDVFEPLYLDMLKSGMTKDVVQLLKPFGLDPTNENFWTDGLNNGLGKMIEEAEKLSRDVGINF